jgi:two-component system, chemotaxis family, protein-glutamate methylesterase/glutaminase
MKKTRVLIVDDSAVVRRMLTDIIGSQPGMEVIGTAADPFLAANHIAREVPDVITLDVEMPRMDGLTFLQRIMSQHPIPVVILSSLTSAGARSAVLALELGAVDVLLKPSFINGPSGTDTHAIVDAVRNAARMSLTRRAVRPLVPIRNKIRIPESMAQTTNKVVAIGVSTGGCAALQEILMSSPIDCQGMVVVQHMPEKFTRAFADRLNDTCPVQVKEAVEGDPVLRGHCLIAPGNKHIELRRSGARYFVTLTDAPPFNRHRPSVDILFNSVARYAGSNAIGVILTGMGADGAQGLLEMKNAGATTIAQDEATSVVFGMPKEAIKLGAADHVLPLHRIAGKVASIA